MTAHVLKSSISVSEPYSAVRNNRSIAHANPPTLNDDESLLIFNHIESSGRFIGSHESRITTYQPEEAAISPRRDPLLTG